MSFFLQQRSLPPAPPRRRPQRIDTVEDLVSPARAGETDPLPDVTYWGEECFATQLTLLPISPQRVLATWSSLHSGRLLPGSRAGSEVPAESLDASCWLKVYDITGVDSFQGDNFNRQWIFELGEDRHERVIELDRPGLVVCAELIRVGATGRPESLARSRRIRLPGGGSAKPGGATVWLIRDGGTV